ncbi:unnamed protein product, partial [Nesidiocoris tenuis]
HQLLRLRFTTRSFSSRERNGKITSSVSDARSASPRLRHERGGRLLKDRSQEMKKENHTDGRKRRWKSEKEKINDRKVYCRRSHLDNSTRKQDSKRIHNTTTTTTTTERCFCSSSEFQQSHNIIIQKTSMNTEVHRPFQRFSRLELFEHLQFNICFCMYRANREVLCVISAQLAQYWLQTGNFFSNIWIHECDITRRCFENPLIWRYLRAINTFVTDYEKRVKAIMIIRSRTLKPVHLCGQKNQRVCSELSCRGRANSDSSNIGTHRWFNPVNAHRRPSFLLGDIRCGPGHALPPLEGYQYTAHVAPRCTIYTRKSSRNSVGRKPPVKPVVTRKVARQREAQSQTSQQDRLRNVLTKRRREWRSKAEETGRDNLLCYWSVLERDGIIGAGATRPVAARRTRMEQHCRNKAAARCEWANWIIRARRAVSKDSIVGTCKGKSYCSGSAGVVSFENCGIECAAARE